MYADRVAEVSAKNKTQLILIPLLVALAVFAVIPAVFTQLFSLSVPVSEKSPINIASAAAMWVTLIGGGYLMCWASKITWRALGFGKEKATVKTLLGAGLGAGLLVLVALVIRLLGGNTWEWTFSSGAILPILVALLFFAAQGTWEELIYRGYLMPHFSRAWGDPISIIVTSLLFAAGHAFNPGMTFMPILNLVIFGFVFGLLYYRTGSMWLTGAAHAAWNFTEAYIFGSEVSGNAAAASVMHSVPSVGRELISGGNFGYEGSIITSLAGLILIVFMTVLWPRRKSTLR